MPEILMLLILLMIVGALVAIETPNLLHAVISIGSVGFLLSIAFLFLAAPDLAITQIAVEVITLVVLLRVVAQSGQPEGSGHRESFGLVVTAALVVVLAVFSIGLLADAPAFGEPVMDRVAGAPSATYVRDGLEETGAANLVTAILLDFRAYDTLGEASVLFCAIVGAMALLRRGTGKHVDGRTSRKDPT